MAKLVVGCGYLGMRAARRWVSAGETVFAVTRSRERATQFAAAGLRPIVGDITAPQTLPVLPAVDDVLFAVGFDPIPNGPSIFDVFVGGLQNIVARLVEPLESFTYISSTGVYGQNDGDWVDEDSPCQPSRDGGKACLAAEQVLETSWLKEKTYILRLAGIYGPGRLPRQADLRAGKPIAAPADGFLNLIHVDDAARVILDLAQRRVPPLKLNVSDGAPALRRDYYEHLASLLHAPPPTFTAPPGQSHAVARASSDKRVSNRRLLAAIRIPLEFPSYREGLANILALDPREF